jgi:hypothetical protein
MRTTVDLPDHIYKHVRNVAHVEHTSFSRVVAEMLERAMVRLPDPELRKDELTGLTVMHFGGPTITHEDVRALEEDE